MSQRLTDAKHIEDKMLHSGLRDEFVADIFEAAADEEGILDLIELWYEYPEERAEIEHDLYEHLVERR